jgi:hypothetical protein
MFYLGGSICGGSMVWCTSGGYRDCLLLPTPLLHCCNPAAAAAVAVAAAAAAELAEALAGMPRLSLSELFLLLLLLLLLVLLQLLLSSQRHWLACPACLLWPLKGGCLMSRETG